MRLDLWTVVLVQMFPDSSSRPREVLKVRLVRLASGSPRASFRAPKKAMIRYTKRYN